MIDEVTEEVCDGMTVAVRNRKPPPGAGSFAPTWD